MADMSTPSSTGGVNPPNMSEELSLNIPRRSAKDLYLFRVLNSVDLFHRYLASADFSKPLRLKTYVRNCVSMIADDELRDTILDNFEDACAYVMSYTGIDATDRTDLLLEVATAVVGDVISYCDEFCGVSRSNVLVPLVDLPDPRIQEAVKDILGKVESEPEPQSASD